VRQQIEFCLNPGPENWDLIRRPSIEYMVYDHNRRPSFNPSCIMHSTIATP